MDCKPYAPEALLVASRPALCQWWGCYSMAEGAGTGCCSGPVVKPRSESSLVPGQGRLKPCGHCWILWRDDAAGRVVVRSLQLQRRPQERKGDGQAGRWEVAEVKGPS